MRLSYERYEEIKQTIANFLEDYDVRNLPVDVFELAKKMKIKIVFSTKLLKKHPNKIDEYFLFKYPHSFLYYNPVQQQIFIYIDDVGCKRERQRFSLAHELMHIILGHTEQNEENEAEANFGASYLLAPTSLTLVNPNNYILLNPAFVEQAFEVSAQAAEIICRYNENRLYCCDFMETDYERTINGLLGESLLIKIELYN